MIFTVRFFSLIILCLVAASCSISRRTLNKRFFETEKKFQDHTGFVLYDIEKSKTVYSYRSDRYYTPASNTKIFTLFASLKILGDSIRAIQYEEQEDSILFWGTGDPGFLYKNVHQTSVVFDFLKNSQKPLYFSSANFHTSHYGPGWAWDDYNDYYTAERSPLPVYGNTLTVSTDGSQYTVSPEFFEPNFSTVESKLDGPFRALHSNNVEIALPKDGRPRKWDVPFITGDVLTTQLLADTLKKQVGVANRKISAAAKTIYSIPADSLYKVLMQESDNFIAEQLLLVCSSVLSDSLKPEITIEYVKKNFLNDLLDKPVWVDGSGLSRYNLFTPRTIVQLWQKIYELVPRERLFSILATGGKNGTVKNWYKSEKPYIFGKTGSLSNNHCLSGYLVTKKGKTLIFSWMNNNFTAPSTEIRKNMQEILRAIYEHY